MNRKVFEIFPHFQVFQQLTFYTQMHGRGFSLSGPRQVHAVYKMHTSRKYIYANTTWRVTSTIPTLYRRYMNTSWQQVWWWQGLAALSSSHSPHSRAVLDLRGLVGVASWHAGSPRCCFCLHVSIVRWWYERCGVDLLDEVSSTGSTQGTGTLG